MTEPEVAGELRPLLISLYATLYPGSVAHKCWTVAVWADDLRTGRNLPPPLEPGSKTEFDPGDGWFGLWVSNDGLTDGGVYSEPALVKRLNKRLSKQPYKAMIYPNRDKTSGKIIPHSYLIGWEYSTNDDFQDVVCQVDNVTLIDEPPPAGPSNRP